MARVLFAFLLAACLPAVAPGAAEAPPRAAKESQPAKPAILVSFERPGIREDDHLGVEVWFSNESGQEFTDVKLEVANPDPDHLQWYADSCTGKPVNPALDLGAVEPYSVISRELCLTSAKQVSIGDFDVLFTFRYHWVGGESFVSTEKLLKVNLLGTESLGGVPLALAGFIVPGLFFCLLLGWVHKPWNIGSALGDRVIYSVLASIGFVALDSWVARWHPDVVGHFGRNWGTWVKNLNVNAGIGVATLIYLALEGGAAGALVGGGARLAAWLLQRRKKKIQQQADAQREVEKQGAEQRRLAEEKKVTPSMEDDEVTLLGKLLMKYPASSCPRTIVRTNGEEYVGSLGMQTKDYALTALVGWFGIKLQQASPETAARVTELVKTRRFAVAHALAQQESLKIEGREDIKKIENGREVPTGVYSWRWADRKAEISADGKKADYEALKIVD